MTGLVFRAAVNLRIAARSLILQLLGGPYISFAALLGGANRSAIAAARRRYRTARPLRPRWLTGSPEDECRAESR